MYSWVCARHWVPPLLPYHLPPRPWALKGWWGQSCPYRLEPSSALQLHLDEHSLHHRPKTLQDLVLAASRPSASLQPRPWQCAPLPRSQPPHLSPACWSLAFPDHLTSSKASPASHHSVVLPSPLSGITLSFHYLSPFSDVSFMTASILFRSPDHQV